MSHADLRLANAPIVEAVLDIDCDMPPGKDIAALEDRARASFTKHYPKFRTQFLAQHEIEQSEDTQPKVSTGRGIQALQFLGEDEKQIVQVRTKGFSFNRLAPYSTLDDYLPEIERAWRLFGELAAPVQVRLIRLRYINRILVPLVEGRVELDNYFIVGPRLPDEERLRLAGFLNQHLAVEKDSGNYVSVILANQPYERDSLPIVFDIEAYRPEAIEPEDWETIHERIQSLRRLKNRVFKKTLTERCLELFG